MQEITFFQLAVIGYGIVMPVIAYFLKDAMDTVKNQGSEIKELKESMTEKYVRRDDFKVFEDRLFLRLDRIETKLDGKPDTK